MYSSMYLCVSVSIHVSTLLFICLSFLLLDYVHSNMYLCCMYVYKTSKEGGPRGPPQAKKNLSIHLKPAAGEKFWDFNLNKRTQNAVQVPNLLWKIQNFPIPKNTPCLVTKRLCYQVPTLYNRKNLKIRSAHRILSQQSQSNEPTVFSQIYSQHFAGCTGTREGPGHSARFKN